jgi:hypothetical protein
MSDPREKKHLRLMPEVLPDPTPVLTPGGPRQRTLATMNRLGALAAAVAVLQSGCGDGNTGGYGVVDPMPAPAQCMGVAETIQATAVWKAKEGGGFVVELTLSKPGRADASYVAGEQVSSWNGKITAAQVTADSAVITIEPPAGEPNANALVGVTCTQGAGHVFAALDVSAPPVAGAAVPVRLEDQF